MLRWVILGIQLILTITECGSCFKIFNISIHRFKRKFCEADWKTIVEKDRFVDVLITGHDI